MKNLERELTHIVYKPSRVDSRPFVKSIHKRYGFKKDGDFHLRDHELTIAFLEKAAIRKLNRDFRSRDRVTDILSFSGSEPKELGELALCGQMVVKQARTHRLRPREELGYLLIHGLLHLLGCEHEKSDKRAEIMFELQDRLFETLLKKGN